MAYHGFLFPLTWMVSGTLSLLFVGSLFLSVFYEMRLTSVYEVSEGLCSNYAAQCQRGISGRTFM